MRTSKTAIIALVGAIMLTLTVYAQDKAPSQEKQASGAIGPVKFSGLMFGDAYYNADQINPEKKDQNGWQFRRIYFTADYTINADFSSRFRLEADQSANTSNGKIGVFVKDAWLKWKNIYSGADLIAGISPTPAFEVSESAWGYRSLEKTILDYFGIVSSRDLGLALKGKFDEKGMASYWVKVGNNSGNAPESNKYKRYYAQVQFKPAAGFQATLYGDFASNKQKADSVTGEMKDNNAFVFAGFANYEHENTFSAGVEAFMKSQQNNYANAGGELASQSGIGLSFWAWAGLTENIKLVARYDMYDPNSDADAKDDQEALIIGAVDFAVAPTVHVMPGVEMHTLEGQDNDDLVPRVTFFWEF